MNTDRRLVRLFHYLDKQNQHSYQNANEKNKKEWWGLLNL